MAERLAEQSQVLARHDRFRLPPCGVGLAGAFQAWRRADNVPAMRDRPLVLSAGVVREQRGIRGARGVRRRGDVLLRGFSKQHCASAGVWIGQVQCVYASNPLARNRRFAAVASGARSSRVAATASDHHRVWWARKARPSRARSSVQRSRAVCFLGFPTKPVHCTLPRRAVHAKRRPQIRPPRTLLDKELHSSETLGPSA